MPPNEIRCWRRRARDGTCMLLLAWVVGSRPFVDLCHWDLRHFPIGLGTLKIFFLEHGDFSPCIVAMHKFRIRNIDKGTRPEDRNPRDFGGLLRGQSADRQRKTSRVSSTGQAGPARCFGPAWRGPRDFRRQLNTRSVCCCCCLRFNYYLYYHY